MPTVSEPQKRLMLAAAHTPGGYGGVPQKVGLEFMHADQKVGRVGKAIGGGFGIPHMGMGMHVGHVGVPHEGGMHMGHSGMGSMVTNMGHSMTPRQHFAEGGMYMPPRPAFGEMMDYRDILNPTAGGVIQSEIPGRTDHIPTSVAANSYVIPADVVSGIGQGNTMAGARIVQEWLNPSKGPYGIPLQRHSERNTMPRPPSGNNNPGRSTVTYKPTFAAKGGKIEEPPPNLEPRAPLKKADLTHDPNEVPVIVAGGEMIIDPHVIAHHPDLGGLDPRDRNPAHYQKAIDFGHKVLDAWVKHQRNLNVKEIQKLPGPSK